LKDILVNRDNASAQNSRLDSEKIESTKAQGVRNPPDVPDLAPRDFDFFRYLAETLHGTLFTQSHDLTWARGQTFPEIPEKY
jgi:hypothetical protein